VIHDSIRFHIATLRDDVGAHMKFIDGALAPFGN
jgi:hypothetical protein